jgi:hypothetical protein
MGSDPDLQGGSTMDPLDPAGTMEVVNAALASTAQGPVGNHPRPKSARRSGLFIGGRARFTRTDDRSKYASDWRDVGAPYKPRSIRTGQERTASPVSSVADTASASEPSVSLEALELVTTSK